MTREKETMGVSEVRTLFFLAGLYDFLIGLGFFAAGAKIFDLTGVTHPNHWAYVQFAALILMVFGLMFFTIAINPIAHRNLMPFGMLLKICYSGLVLYYWVFEDCPFLFKPFAIIDLVMLALFLTAFLRTPAITPQPGQSP